MQTDTLRIQTDLVENTNKLLQFLHQVKEATFIHKPTPEKWSVLETFDHLITTEGLIVGIFYGETETVDRNPEMVIQKIEKAFYNYERKFTAMPPIHPQGKVLTKQAVEANLVQIREGFIQKGQQVGWSQLCTAFPHPLVGTMTTYEWVYFCIIHANRHLTLMKQMHNQTMEARD